MPNRRDFDHIGNFNFRVEIDGVTQGAFQEVSGLEARAEVVEFRDGVDLVLRKRPGHISYTNIILKRGYTASDELWNWMKTVIDGRIERKAGSVVLAGDDGSEIMRYNFFEAWPCRWKGFALDGKGTGVLVEELELVVEMLERG